MLRSLFCRWFRVGCRRPEPFVPVPSHGIPGVVVHVATPDVVAAVQATGVKHVRWTLYLADERTDPQAAPFYWADSLRLFDQAGLTPLIIVHDFARRDDIVPTMQRLTAQFPHRLWQIGNEWDYAHWPKDRWFAGLTGAGYAQILREVQAAIPGIQMVGQGCCWPVNATATDALASQSRFLDSYLAANGPTLRAWCLHAYGNDNHMPVLAADALQRLNGRMPLWVTEFGSNRTDQEQGLIWTATLASAKQAGVERLYGYCMAGDDGFGIMGRPAATALTAYATSLIPTS